MQRPGLEDCDGAGQLRTLLKVLQQDHIVREVGKPFLRDPLQLKQLRHLDDHHQADPRALQPLRQ